MLIVLLAQLLGSYLDLCVDIFNSKSGSASSLGVLNFTLAFKISCFIIEYCKKKNTAKSYNPIILKKIVKGTVEKHGCLKFWQTYKMIFFLNCNKR